MTRPNVARQHRSAVTAGMSGTHVGAAHTGTNQPLSTSPNKPLHPTERPASRCSAAGGLRPARQPPRRPVPKGRPVRAVLRRPVQPQDRPGVADSWDQVTAPDLPDVKQSPNKRLLPAVHLGRAQRGPTPRDRAAGRSAGGGSCQNRPDRKARAIRSDGGSGRHLRPDLYPDPQPVCQGVNSFHRPSDTTSTAPLSILIAVSSSIA